MKPFKKGELIGVLIIFSIVFLITLSNLKISLRRSRDATRKQDLGGISDALYKYYQDYGFFPPSEEGKIKACKGNTFEEVLHELEESKRFDRNKYFNGLRGCNWGKDSFSDLFEISSSPYLNLIPQDPKQGEGLSYYYLSNSVRFQLYTYLEGESEEDGFNHGIVARNLSCGMKICSYGKSYSDTPLDISIDEYEKILYERAKSGKIPQ